ITFDVRNATNDEKLAESLNVIIQIQDINDNAPQFSQQEFNIIIKGNYHKGQNFYRMIAFDADQKGTANSEVVYSLISQTPQLKLPLFFIDSSSGFMNITQCLDYEANRKFRVLIMASDLGSSPKSSTAAVNIIVEDSNYYLPEFTIKYRTLSVSSKYHADVPKNTSESNILRLKVKDKDSPNTPAWRAKYTIRTGNERGNFVVFTDAITNEGILRVVKPWVFGSPSARRLVIVVENELPFFLCEGGLQPPFSEASVSINIIDENYPPQFSPPILHLEYQEGVKAGTTLYSYLAHDSGTAQDKIRYKIGSDPRGWLMISENYGIVTIAKTLGREALFMNKTILIHAIDDGIPPLTGTGTIQLYIRPSELIIVPNLTICEGKGLGPFRITREVKDYNLYAESLTVQLEDSLEDIPNLWRLEKSSGNLVELFMLKNLSPSEYLVPLRIQDLQGFFRQQTLNVQVRPCPDGIKYDFTEAITAEPIAGTMGPVVIISITVTIFLLLISFLGILFRYSFILKANKKSPFIPYEGGNQSLIHYNEESERVLKSPDLTGMIQPTVGPSTGSSFIKILNRKPIKPRNQGTLWSNNNTKISEFLKTVEITLKQKCKEINNRVDYVVSYMPHVLAIHNFHYTLGNDIIVHKDQPKRSKQLFNKASQNTSIKYSVSGPGVDEFPEYGLFSIEDDARGLVYVHYSIDRERTPSFPVLISSHLTSPHLTLSQFEPLSSPLLSSPLSSPLLSSPSTLEGDLGRGILLSYIVHFIAVDKDQEDTANSEVVFCLVSQTPELKPPLFTIDSTSGLIHITQCLDYEPLVYSTPSERRLLIVVKNEESFFTCKRGFVNTNASPQLPEVSVSINITDENNAPQFNPPILKLSQQEGVMPGTKLVQYEAQDPDPGQHKIKYKVVSDPAGWVTIDENSAIVTAAKTLDRESPFVNNNTYTIVIHATDDGKSILFDYL
ncbi:Cadherin-like protein 26, partial [Ophiophagus hannah]